MKKRVSPYLSFSGFRFNTYPRTWRVHIFASNKKLEKRHIHYKSTYNKKITVYLYTGTRFKLFAAFFYIFWCLLLLLLLTIVIISSDDEENSIALDGFWELFKEILHLASSKSGLFDIIPYIPSPNPEAGAGEGTGHGAGAGTGDGAGAGTGDGSEADSGYDT